MNPTRFHDNVTFTNICYKALAHFKTQKPTNFPKNKITAMSALITEDLRSKAEVYNGDEICREKSQFLLTEVGLPNGLLPMKDMVECGYVKDTGFVWLKQKKSTNHKFDKIGKLVSYAPEITAIVEKGKIKKLTGVKTKELMLWVTLSDIYIDDPPTGKITFQTPAGLYRTFPTSAFEVEGTVATKDPKEEVKEVKAVEV